MENIVCAGCGADIIIKVASEKRSSGFTSGTTLRCNRCGKVLFLGDYNPESVEAFGAQKVEY